MRLNYPLTPFKLAMLSALDGRGSRPFNNIGCHPAHKRRVLRELQEMGTVSRSIHDAWSITRHGVAASDAYLGCRGNPAQRLRAAEKALRASHGMEQLFDPERT